MSTNRLLLLTASFIIATGCTSIADPGPLAIDVAELSQPTSRELIDAQANGHGRAIPTAQVENCFAFWHIETQGWSIRGRGSYADIRTKDISLVSGRFTNISASERGKQIGDGLFGGVISSYSTRTAGVYQLENAFLLAPGLDFLDGDIIEVTANIYGVNGKLMATATPCRFVFPGSYTGPWP